LNVEKSTTNNNGFTERELGMIDGADYLRGYETVEAYRLLRHVVSLAKDRFQRAVIAAEREKAEAAAAAEREKAEAAAAAERQVRERDQRIERIRSASAYLLSQFSSRHIATVQEAIERAKQESPNNWKIPAIKNVRLLLGICLKEAKDAVEAAIEVLSVTPEEFAGYLVENIMPLDVAGVPGFDSNSVVIFAANGYHA
jgi:ribosomal protein L7/L12